MGVSFFTFSLILSCVLNRLLFIPLYGYTGDCYSVNSSHIINLFYIVFLLVYWKVDFLVLKDLFVVCNSAVELISYVC